MTNLLSDGGRVLWQDLGSVLIVLTCMLWGSIATAAAVRSPDDNGGTASEYLSLAMGGWLVALLLIAAPTFVVGAVFGLRPGLAVAGIALAASAGCLVLLIRRQARPVNASEVRSLLGLLALLILSVWIRLAFIVRTALPLYFDSAEHYRIIRALMLTYGQALPLGSPAWPVPTYYHVGFHLILSVLAFITTQAPADLILVFGQIVVAATPFCLYVIVRRETQSIAAGFAATAFGIAGWYMPAYAANWGKYPALFSLPVILLCLTLAYLAKHAEGAYRRRLVILAALAAGAAFLFQTRSIILLAIGLAAWWLASRWSSLRGPRRWFIVGLILLIVFVQGILLVADPILSAMLDPYARSGVLMTGLAAFLGIVAFRQHGRLALACLISVLLLLLGVYLPVPGFAASSLLDRPLVEMVLYVPLAILGAAGLAGVLEHFGTAAVPVKGAAVALLCVAIAFNALANYGFYPADCCTLVHRDDLVALDWIGRNLPADARVAIPYAELRDAPSPYLPLRASTDAGVWITPLTGRPTTNLPYSTDFSTSTTLATLCSAGVSDVYVSVTSQGFQVESLDSEPGWYKLQLALPGARIYQVMACAT